MMGEGNLLISQGDLCMGDVIKWCLNVLVSCITKFLCFWVEISPILDS